jgi:tetratricopeptide (TPR) repeat protein
VDCTSEVTVRADFKSIASLCGWSADDADMCCGAKDQLASLDESTLLILDNCDDPTINFSHYIPSSPQVSVIFTTRLSDAGKYATSDPDDVSTNMFLRLGGLDADSATDLILKASEVQERDVKSTQEARHIAEVLNHHPLALIVASSLIQSTTYSLEEYAEALATRFPQSELLNTESEQATYRKVSATFEVSTDTLKTLSTTDPSALNALALLDILAFFHHQGVSEDIFVRAWDDAEEVSSRSRDKDWPSEHLTLWHVIQSQYLAVHGTADEKKRAFRRCRAHLIKLSLVSIDATGCVVSLHPLVHTWARERVQHPVEAWTAAASTLSLSTKGHLTWHAFTPPLAKHMAACLAFGRSSSAMIPSSLEICRIWVLFTWQMHSARSPGTTELCERLSEQLSDGKYCKELLVSSQYLLGILYGRDRQILRAMKILEHVVKEQEKLGDDHPNRLASQHELARVYKADGQVSRAIEILEHVVRVREKLAEDHPSRLSSQQQLANAYKANGQFPQAIEMFEHVVEIRKKLADDHPKRLGSQHQLAGAYKADGQISRAIEILDHVVKMNEKLADDHPNRLASQHDLAVAYWDSGRKSEAERLFRQVTTVQEECLRADHPDRVSSEGFLADIVQENSGALDPSPDASAGAELTPDDPSALDSQDNALYRRVAIPRKRKHESPEGFLTKKRSLVSDDR